MHYNFKKYLREYLRNEVRSIIHEELNEQQQNLPWLEVVPSSNSFAKQRGLGDPRASKDPLEVLPGDKKPADDDDGPPWWCDGCMEVPCPEGTTGPGRCWGQPMGNGWLVIYCSNGNICGYMKLCKNGIDICLTVWCPGSVQTACEMEIDPNTGIIYPCGMDNVEGFMCAPYHIDGNGWRVLDDMWLCEHMPSLCGLDIRMDQNGNWWVACAKASPTCICGNFGCWRRLTAEDFNPSGTQDEIDEEGIAECIANGGNIAACIFDLLPDWLQELIKFAFGVAVLLLLIWLIAWLTLEILQLLQDYGNQQGWPSNPMDPNDPTDPGDGQNPDDDWMPTDPTDPGDPGGGGGDPGGGGGDPGGGGGDPGGGGGGPPPWG